MGQKKNDEETIPLCLYHHRAGPESFHLGRSYFLEHYGTETYLLEEVNKLL